MACESIPQLDLDLYEGDNTTLKFRYKAEDIPVDITDYVIQLECTLESLSRTAIIADQTTEPGVYSFLYIPSDTLAITANRVKYEVVFYPTGLAGSKNTKYKGSLVIAKEVVA